MDIQRHKRGSWWSHMSLVNPAEVELSLHLKLYSKKMTQIENKNAYFPGIETPRKRILSTPTLLIDADSKLKFYWDFLIALLSLTLSIQIPYSLSFFQDVDINFWIFTTIFLIFDFLLNFNVSYYSKGMLVYKRKAVAVHYLKKNFWIDLFAAFPFEFLFLNKFNSHENSIRAFRSISDLSRCVLLFKLLKLYKIPKFLYQIEMHYSNPAAYSTVKVLTYLLAAFVPAHWTACLFNALYCYNFENTQLYAGLEIDASADRYLKFFEKTLETMTSVGYGEFLSKSINEKIVNIFVMCLTSGFLGVFVGAIILAIEKSIETSIFFRQVMQKCTVYFMKHKIPKSLQMRVANYLRHLKFSYKNNLLKEEDIVKILSIPLKEQIFNHTRGYLLGLIPQFKEISRGLLKALGDKMNLNFYAPEDLILRQGENTSDLHFIFSGSVKIVHEKTNTTFTKLVKNGFFGEIGFFSNRVRTASAQSQSFAEIFSLTRFDFDEVLRSMPKDYEKIQTLLRNLSTYGLVILGTKCFLCKDIGHVATDCSKSSWKLNINSIMENVQKKRETSKQSNKASRIVANCNYLQNFSVIRTRGIRLNEEKAFTDRRYLIRKIVHYNHSVNNINKVNDKLFTLINELSENDNKEEFTEESNESEKIFLNFSVSQIEPRKSSVVYEHLTFLHHIKK